MIVNCLKDWTLVTLRNKNKNVKRCSVKDNSKGEGEINGSFKEALERKLRPDSSPMTSGRKAAVIVKDDPNCPNVFKVDKLKKKSDPGTHFNIT